MEERKESLRNGFNLRSFSWQGPRSLYFVVLPDSLWPWLNFTDVTIWKFEIGKSWRLSEQKRFSKFRKAQSGRCLETVCRDAILRQRQEYISVLLFVVENLLTTAAEYCLVSHLLAELVRNLKLFQKTWTAFDYGFYHLGCWLLGKILFSDSFTIHA